MKSGPRNVIFPTRKVAIEFKNKIYFNLRLYQNENEKLTVPPTKITDKSKKLNKK